MTDLACRRRRQGTAMSRSWPDAEHCHVHGREPMDGDPYRVCGECWHAFPTETDLRAADAQMCAELRDVTGLDTPRPSAGPVTVCPYCTHDLAGVALP